MKQLLTTTLIIITLSGCICAPYPPELIPKKIDTNIKQKERSQLDNIPAQQP